MCVLAFGGGWWMRGYFMQPQIQARNTYTHTTRESPPQVIVVEKNGPQITATSNASQLPNVKPVVAPPPEQSFAQFRLLLAQQQFVSAVDYYANQETVLPLKETQQWRSHLTDFLAGKLNNGEIESFLELSELWLQEHYSDIEVLLLQAQYYRGLGYFSEALQSYLQARTYADTEQQRKRVYDELQNFIFQRDTDYTEQGDWQALLIFYAKLYDLDVANANQKFRYAELLLMFSDEKLAVSILDQLQVAWKPKAQQLLSQYRREGGYHAGKSQSTGFQSEIAMAPVGSHYLLTITLNDTSNHHLLLDTGASITMLSEESFNVASQGSGWQEMGWSLFNTANGIARGRMMQVDRLQLGDYVLKDVRVAVQSADFGNGVDGLLGMNVLRQFQFQIDQDNHRLLLSPRE